MMNHPRIIMYLAMIAGAANVAGMIWVIWLWSMGYVR